jgi:amino acid transporter
MRADGPSDESEPVATLGLLDAVCLVVGIVVGTAIFRSTPTVFTACGSPVKALAAWGAGGALSLLGAFCYAELATTYPRSGGDYVYLTRAFGPWAGFFFGWLQLTAVLASSIGAMAFALADYAAEAFSISSGLHPWIAVAAIVGLTAINAAGASAGPRIQVLLTVVKVAGLGGVLLCGVVAALGDGAPPDPATSPAAPSGGSLGLAMVLVLYAYGGWNDAAFVAAEVRNRRRNVPLALVGGVVAITLLYLAMNLAYLAALGYGDACTTITPAAAVVERVVGPSAAHLAAALVMISALGAINGMLLTGSRLYAALGADYRNLGWLSGRSGASGPPQAALIAQAAVIVAMILAVGVEAGRNQIDRLLAAIGAPTIPWEFYNGGFEALVAATAPVFWLLFLATGVAMLVLRRREPLRERPFAAPWYPLPPLAFCGMCLYMLWQSLQYAGWLALATAIPAAAGLVVFAVARSRRPHPSVDK